MNEIWKPVVGYEGLYEVSNFGNVRSLAREVCYRKNGKTIIRHVESRVLKPGNRHGYKGVGLCKNGKQKCKQVHRLVAEAFIDNPNSKQEVNHIDENTSNNHVNNLEWVTHIEN